MHLVTLDLATRIGWTAGPHTSRDFQFGSYTLPSTGEDVGKFAQAAHDWLREFFPVPAKDWLVVFEQPIMPKDAHLVTLRKLYGLAWHVEFYFSGRCEVAEANNSSVKKQFTGSGRAQKDDMVAAAVAAGFAAENHDQADAIALRMFTLGQRWPEFRGLDGGLGALGAAAR